MDINVVITQVLVLLIPILVGYFVRKQEIVDKNFAKSLSSLIFNILGPCLTIKAMRYDFTVEALQKSGILILISVLLITVTFIIGYFLGKLISKDFDTRVLVEFAVSCSNFSFMGIPVMTAVFGQEGAFYASIFNIAYFFYANCVAIFLMQRKTAKNGAADFFKTLFNPQTVGVIIGFLLFLFPVELPEVLNRTIDMFGDASIPTSMMLGGIVLGGSNLKGLLKDWRLYLISAVRLLGIPLLVFAVLKLLGMTGVLLYVPVIISAMPVANNVVILSERYDKNSPFAAKCVAISSFLSIITIPAIYYITL